MIALEEQQELFALIGKSLKKPIECFLIGGSAMLYYGAKQVTKDIDIVFKNERDRGDVIKVLEKLGYKSGETELIYFEKPSKPILLQRGDTRFDLFCKKIINFTLTQTIIERITAVYEYGNLITRIVSPEDIIVLKCATERIGDRLDASELIKKGVNWDIIINEAKEQMKFTEKIVPVFLFDFLLELQEDFKVEIPEKIIRELEFLSKEKLAEAKRKGKIIMAKKYKKI